MDGDVLGVHSVLADGGALDGLEGAGTNVQRHLLAVDAVSVEGLEHARREVQTGCRGGHAALDFRIDGLIGGLVALLRLAVQVWRYGQLAHSVDNLGKGDAARPLEVDEVARALLAVVARAYGDRLAADGDVARQRARLPLLQVAHQAEPRAVLALLEHLLVVARRSGLQQKYLDEGALAPLAFLLGTLLAEVHACLNDTRIVEHHQSAFWQVLGQVAERVLAYLTVTVDKQLRRVALGLGELRDALIGKRIVVVADLYVFGFHHVFRRCTRAAVHRYK